MLPLEDTHLDILGKAQRGLNLADEELLKRSSLSAEELQQIRSGAVDRTLLEKIAPPLQLNPVALLASAEKKWTPQAIEISNFKMFTTPFEEMTVNAYLVWDQKSGIAAAFDTGGDVTEMLGFAKDHSLQIQSIFITHTHIDHLFDLDRLSEKTGATSYVGDREPKLEGSQSFTAGKEFHVGSLAIETRLTWGHCEGGITYLIRGLERPVAVVGDALYAGSMGGGMVSWSDALRTTRAEILSLPDETLIASGHGPLTTVAESKINNPFFTF
jgi:glyoxylase-like metal-dependent hydrolase (beta-lactamase superfamily II)